MTDDTSAPAPLHIDVVSDVVCPWCYIGKHRLEAAMALVPDIAVDVTWRPFFLNPWIPREGIDRKTYLETKFGSVARYSAIAERVVAAAAAEGLLYAPDKVSRQPNTLDSHRLILWSRSATDPGRMKQRLMQLYFAEGADLSDPATLVQAAIDCGMDGDLVRKLLASDADVERVEARRQQRQGSRHRRRALLHLRRQHHRHRRAIAGLSRRGHAAGGREADAVTSLTNPCVARHADSHVKRRIAAARTPK